ncbi:Pycsar system effector family protein [Pseudofrankia inefficax]|uniref:Pycsar effector protein domain-containing protein n=1 Tax=Pseudofrankia inefficax (strain DSM 45817 / CECT 9037 / DDB 130130 / EuI1c) TaxID=298654 RepID=E3J414_PSEI1|nr:Pycsar system effector family protein [Pseudofrankia inefficax]ADP81793.1 hypothetical protein FraEuI1c_3786 [Pseudofrankia inefficax]
MTGSGTGGTASSSQPGGSAPAQDVNADGAVSAIEMMSGWINNADGKIGILAAALAVLGGAVAKDKDTIFRMFGDLTGHGHGAFAVRNGLAVAFFCLGVIALAVAAYSLYRGIRPRTPNDGPSRFSYPHLSTITVQDALALSPATQREEAWRQAHTLAVIAMAKFGNFRRALTFAGIAALLFLVWMFVLPS